jgi:hypothetical protein
MHNIAMHHITIHHITMHHITMHHIAMHCIEMHFIAMHHIAMHHITMHHVAMHPIASPDMAARWASIDATSVCRRHYPPYWPPHPASLSAECSAVQCSAVQCSAVQCSAPYFPSAGWSHYRPKWFCSTCVNILLHYDFIEIQGRRSFYQPCPKCQTGSEDGMGT